MTDDVQPRVWSGDAEEGYLRTLDFALLVFDMEDLVDEMVANRLRMEKAGKAFWSIIET